LLNITGIKIFNVIIEMKDEDEDGRKRGKEGREVIVVIIRYYDDNE